MRARKPRLLRRKSCVSLHALEVTLYADKSKALAGRQDRYCIFCGRDSRPKGSERLFPQPEEHQVHPCPRRYCDTCVDKSKIIIKSYRTGEYEVLCCPICSYRHWDIVSPFDSFKNRGWDEHRLPEKGKFEQRRWSAWEKGIKDKKRLNTYHQFTDIDDMSPQRDQIILKKLSTVGQWTLGETLAFGNVPRSDDHAKGIACFKQGSRTNVSNMLVASYNSFIPPAMATGIVSRCPESAPEIAHDTSPARKRSRLMLTPSPPTEELITLKSETLREDVPIAPSAAPKRDNFQALLQKANLELFERGTEVKILTRQKDRLLADLETSKNNGKIARSACQQAREQSRALESRCDQMEAEMQTESKKLDDERCEHLRLIVQLRLDLEVQSDKARKEVESLKCKCRSLCTTIKHVTEEIKRELMVVRQSLKDAQQQVQKGMQTHRTEAQKALLAQKEVRSLRRQMTKLEKVIDTNEKTFDDWKVITQGQLQDCAKAEKDAEILQSRVRVLVFELSDAVERAAVSEEKAAKHGQAIQSAKETIRTLQEVIKEKIEAVQSAESQVKALQQRVQDQDSHIVDHTDEVKSLNIDIHNQNQELLEARQSALTLQQQYDDYLKHLTAANTQIKESNDRADAARKAESKARNDERKSACEIVDLKQRLDWLRNELRTKETEIERLQAELEKASDSNSKARNVSGRHLNKIAELEEGVKNQKETLEYFRVTHSRLNAEQKQLQDELARVIEQLEDVRKELRQAQDEKESTIRLKHFELEQLEADFKKMRRERDERQLEVARLTDQSTQKIKVISDQHEKMKCLEQDMALLAHKLATIYEDIRRRCSTGGYDLTGLKLDDPLSNEIWQRLQQYPEVLRLFKCLPPIATVSNQPMTGPAPAATINAWVSDALRFAPAANMIGATALPLSDYGHVRVPSTSLEQAQSNDQTETMPINELEANETVPFVSARDTDTIVCQRNTAKQQPRPNHQTPAASSSTPQKSRKP